MRIVGLTEAELAARAEREEKAKAEAEKANNPSKSKENKRREGSLKTPSLFSSVRSAYGLH